MTNAASTGFTRRRFLRTALNLGVGAGAVWSFGTEFVSPGDTVEIEYALTRSSSAARSLTSRTKAVPADWHASVDAAFDAQRKLRALGLSEIVGAFVVPGSFDEPAGSIAVDATSERVGDAVGEVADDIDIALNVLDALPPRPDPEAPDAPYRIADVDRRQIPGGVAVSAPERLGTLAPAAYDDQRARRYFVVSNHLYGAEGAKSTDHRNAPLSVESAAETPTVGRVDRGYPAVDVARVEPADEFIPVSRLARATPSRVVGQFTKIGLADLAARDVPLRKFGAFSGYTTGTIHGVDGFTCYLGAVCKPGQLKWGDKRSMTDGDSGSVTYVPDPEHPKEAVIVGSVNNARSWWPGADFAWGTGAHQLLETCGLHF